MKYAVFIYEGVEPIDIGAAFGVLSMAKRVEPSIETFALAKLPGIVECANGLKVTADFGFDDCPTFDALIVTGGPGWPDVAKDPCTKRFLASLTAPAKIAAICTGGMILAEAGLLEGRAATTKSEVIGVERPPLEFMAGYSGVEAKKAVAVYSDSVLTSGGVTLGIDGIFYLLRLLHGERVARETARIMEYERALAANAKALPPVNLPPFVA